MIRSEQAANIADLVNSSSELFFSGGTLRYALSAALRGAVGIGADGPARHGVPQRRGLRVLQPDDRAQARGASMSHEILFDDETLDEFAEDRTPFGGDRGRAPAAAGPLARRCVRQDRASGGPHMAQAWSKAGRVASTHCSLNGISTLVPTLRLQARLAADAVAVDARDVDRRQRRQREHAWLPRDRPAAVLGRARQHRRCRWRRPIRCT